MTEIAVDDGAGARVHAFVVGVARYPYVGRGLGTGSARRLLDDLDQVTVPEPCAVEVAQWLLGTPRQPDNPPVGTVEVLISSPGGQSAVVRTRDGVPVEVESATFANFRTAFRRWRGRCAGDRDNVAVFYFCGHGWEKGEQLLLLEDLGEDPSALLEHAVDLGDIRAVMHLTGARVQAYFVDTCRELPLDLLVNGARPGTVEDVPALTGPLPRVEAPVFCSTTAGHSAFGDGGKVTPFTAGLIAALNGLGAKRRDGRWAVTTGSLADRLHGILDWERPDGAEQDLCIGGQWAGRAVLHSLAAPPMVPFRIDCQPAGAPPPERIEVRPLTSPGRRPPLEVIDATTDRLAAGGYEVHPRFPAGSGFSAEPFFHPVDTPNTVLLVSVRPRDGDGT